MEFALSGHAGLRLWKKNSDEYRFKKGSRPDNTATQCNADGLS